MSDCPDNYHKLTYSRRALLKGAVGLTGVGILSACTHVSPNLDNSSSGNSSSLANNNSLLNQTNSPTVSLTAKPTTIQLDGKNYSTWSYNDKIPGEVIRVTQGKPVTIEFTNSLPSETTVHWHGIHIVNSMDGVPDITQPAVKPGKKFTYSFIPPNAGTHFYHSHVGLQIDRGLYGPLIVEDPTEKLAYDEEWILVLDDWLDGVNSTPEQELQTLQKGKSSSQHQHAHSSMPMDHAQDTMKVDMSDMGDVAYPFYLINGHTSSKPEIFKTKLGKRIRLRIINASGDTVFQLGVAGQELLVTHTDGYPVQPTKTETLVIGMGERYDALLTLNESGSFPLIAVPVGKTGLAKAVLQVGEVTTDTQVSPDLLKHKKTLTGTDLIPAQPADMLKQATPPLVEVVLGGQMYPYVWTINGKKYENRQPIMVDKNQPIRMKIINNTTMTHPMHIHGHTWYLPEYQGLRKDTVLVPAKQTLLADLIPNNPGKWVFHCHNVYHMVAGMMTTVEYRK